MLRLFRSPILLPVLLEPMDALRLPQEPWVALNKDLLFFWSSPACHF